MNVLEDTFKSNSQAAASSFMQESEVASSV